MLKLIIKLKNLTAIEVSSFNGESSVYSVTLVTTHLVNDCGKEIQIPLKSLYLTANHLFIQSCYLQKTELTAMVKKSKV